MSFTLPSLTNHKDGSTRPERRRPPMPPPTRFPPAVREPLSRNSETTPHHPSKGKDRNTNRDGDHTPKPPEPRRAPTPPAQEQQASARQPAPPSLPSTVPPASQLRTRLQALRDEDATLSHTEAVARIASNEQSRRRLVEADERVAWRRELLGLAAASYLTVAEHDIKRDETRQRAELQTLWWVLLQRNIVQPMFLQELCLNEAQDRATLQRIEKTTFSMTFEREHHALVSTAENNEKPDQQHTLVSTTTIGGVGGVAHRSQFVDALRLAALPCIQRVGRNYLTVVRLRRRNRALFNKHIANDEVAGREHVELLWSNLNRTYLAPLLARVLLEGDCMERRRRFVSDEAMKGVEFLRKREQCGKIEFGEQETGRRHEEEREARAFMAVEYTWSFFHNVQQKELEERRRLHELRQWLNSERSMNCLVTMQKAVKLIQKRKLGHRRSMHLLRSKISKYRNGVKRLHYNHRVAKNIQEGTEEAYQRDFGRHVTALQVQNEESDAPRPLSYREKLKQFFSNRRECLERGEEMGRKKIEAFVERRFQHIEAECHDMLTPLCEASILTLFRVEEEHRYNIRVEEETHLKLHRIEHEETRKRCHDAMFWEKVDRDKLYRLFRRNAPGMELTIAANATMRAWRGFIARRRVAEIRTEITRKELELYQTNPEEFQELQEKKRSARIERRRSLKEQEDRESTMELLSTTRLIEEDTAYDAVVTEIYDAAMAMHMEHGAETYHNPPDSDAPQPLQRRRSSIRPKPSRFVKKAMQSPISPGGADQSSSEEDDEEQEVQHTEVEENQTSLETPTETKDGDAAESSSEDSSSLNNTARQLDAKMTATKNKKFLMSPQSTVSLLQVATPQPLSLGGDSGETHLAAPTTHLGVGSSPWTHPLLSHGHREGEDAAATSEADAQLNAILSRHTAEYQRTHDPTPSSSRLSGTTSGTLTTDETPSPRRGRVILLEEAPSAKKEQESLHPSPPKPKKLKKVKKNRKAGSQQGSMAKKRSAKQVSFHDNGNTEESSSAPHPKTNASEFGPRRHSEQTTATASASREESEKDDDDEYEMVTDTEDDEEAMPITLEVDEDGRYIVTEANKALFIQQVGGAETVIAEALETIVEDEEVLRAVLTDSMERHLAYADIYREAIFFEHLKHLPFAGYLRDLERHGRDRALVDASLENELHRMQQLRKQFVLDVDLEIACEKMERSHIVNDQLAAWSELTISIRESREFAWVQRTLAINHMFVEWEKTRQTNVVAFEEEAWGVSIVAVHNMVRTLLEAAQANLERFVSAGVSDEEIVEKEGESYKEFIARERAQRIRREHQQAFKNFSTLSSTATIIQRAWQRRGKTSMAQTVLNINRLHKEQSAMKRRSSMISGNVHSALSGVHEQRRVNASATFSKDTVGRRQSLARRGSLAGGLPTPRTPANKDTIVEADVVASDHDDEDAEDSSSCCHDIAGYDLDMHTHIVATRFSMDFDYAQKLAAAEISEEKATMTLAWLEGVEEIERDDLINLHLEQLENAIWRPHFMRGVVDPAFDNAKQALVETEATEREQIQHAAMVGLQTAMCSTACDALHALSTMRHHSLYHGVVAGEGSLPPTVLTIVAAAANDEAQRLAEEDRYIDDAVAYPKSSTIRDVAAGAVVVGYIEEEVIVEDADTSVQSNTVGVGLNVENIVAMSSQSPNRDTAAWRQRKRQEQHSEPHCTIPLTEIRKDSQALRVTLTQALQAIATQFILDTAVEMMMLTQATEQQERHALKERHTQLRALIDVNRLVPAFADSQLRVGASQPKSTLKLFTRRPTTTTTSGGKVDGKTSRGDAMKRLGGQETFARECIEHDESGALAVVLNDAHYDREHALMVMQLQIEGKGRAAIVVEEDQVRLGDEETNEQPRSGGILHSRSHELQFDLLTTEAKEYNDRQAIEVERMTFVAELYLGLHAAYGEKVLMPQYLLELYNPKHSVHYLYDEVSEELLYSLRNPTKKLNTVQIIEENARSHIQEQEGILFALSIVAPCARALEAEEARWRSELLLLERSTFHNEVLVHAPKKEQ